MDTIKKYILIILIILNIIIWSIPVKATISLMSQANVGECISGFSRLTPNYCKRDNLTFPGWTDIIACTARTTGLSLPSTAKIIDIQIEWQALSLNIANTSVLNSVNFYNNTTCVGNANAQSFIEVLEQSAIAPAGSSIYRGNYVMKVLLVSTDTFYTKQSNAGGNGNAQILSYSILGYYD